MLPHLSLFPPPESWEEGHRSSRKPPYPGNTSTFIVDLHVLHDSDPASSVTSFPAVGPLASGLQPHHYPSKLSLSLSASTLADASPGMALLSLTAFRSLLRPRLLIKAFLATFSLPYAHNLHHFVRLIFTGHDIEPHTLNMLPLSPTEMQTQSARGSCIVTTLL